MKQVTFSPVARPSTTTIYSVKDLIVKFLMKHGMETDISDWIEVKNESVLSFKISCANNNYTRAFALLQLVFSSYSSPAYFRYWVGDRGRDAINLVITSVEETYSHLLNHMEVKIS